MNLIGFFFSFLLALSFGYLIFTVFAVRSFVRSHKVKPFPADYFPPVTVFKPVRGVRSSFSMGPESSEIFRTFLTQDYPRYQIIFGVQDPKDPVLPVLEELQKEAKENVEITIVVDSTRTGINPKISNLCNMEKVAKHEFFVISDSDIMVSPDYLTKTVNPFSDSSVGVVTSIYKAKVSPCRTFAEKLVMALEALTISADYMPSVLVANCLRKTGFAFGQSMAVRRKALDAIGGLKALANCNADDYQLGARVAKAGFRVFLSGYPVETVLSPEPFKDFLARRLRWSRAIFVCEPWGYLGSGVTYLLPLSLFNLLAWGGAPFSWNLLFLAIIAKIVVSILNNQLLLQDATLRSSWWLIPLNDLLGFGIWCAGLFPRPVVWYGERYLLKGDGTMERVLRQGMLRSSSKED